MGGGLHWGSASVSQARFGAQEFGEGAAIPDGKAQGLTVGGGDHDFILGIDVQSPSFE